MFNRLMADINRFFQGRNGFDQLTFAILVVGMILRFIIRLVHIYPLRFVYYAALLWAIFRVVSKNIPRRQEENEKFLAFWYGLKGAFQKRQANYQNQELQYTYLKCPDCGQPLRVPKGKGTISIICPKCGSQTTRHV